jgi:signal transduction histidine kinase
VTARGTLEQRVGLWFAFSLLALYLVVAAGVWGSSYRNGRTNALIMLKTEAEAVASYVATRGRLDAPELAEPEEDPFPIWVRVSSGGKTLAETPGTPAVAAGAPQSTDQALYQRVAGQREPYLVVRHAVGGLGAHLGPHLTVEAIGDVHPIRTVERRLGWGLALLGVLLLAPAAWGGRVLARRALAPIGGLVADIRDLDPGRVDRRLDVPAGAVDEVAVLAEAFNGVLARLEVSLESMRRFTADASHEIRNPLAAMRTGVEVALRRARTPEEYRALLAENLDEIVRLQSVLEGLLELARIQPGAPVPLQRGPVDLERLARRTAERFATVAAEREVRIEVVAEAARPVEGDERLLRLVLFNLIDNALKYGPAGRPVTVAIRGDAGRLRIQVTDRGNGVPSELAERVFERGVRGPAAAGRSEAGGLGLAVVRWVAEAHGGSARLSSGGEGTTFEVELPAGAAGAVAAGA